MWKKRKEEYVYFNDFDPECTVTWCWAYALAEIFFEAVQYDG
jgi:hypothetical protein